MGPGWCQEKLFFSILGISAAIIIGAQYIQGPQSDMWIPSVPGAVLTDDLNVICRHGYSASVRPPEEESEAYKRELMRQLPAGVSHRLGAYRLDDKVPLECGGKPGPANWWLQPVDQADNKDRKEEWPICRAVCEHKINIHDAQQYFLDWPYGSLKNE